MLIESQFCRTPCDNSFSIFTWAGQFTRFRFFRQVQNFHKILENFSENPLDRIKFTLYTTSSHRGRGPNLDCAAPGGELGSTGYRKFKLRVVVGQQAT